MLIINHRRRATMAGDAGHANLRRRHERYAGFTSVVILLLIPPRQCRSPFARLKSMMRTLPHAEALRLRYAEWGIWIATAIR